jgi:hypothetical protein
MGELLAAAGRDGEARDVLTIVPKLSADSVIVLRARELLAQLSLAQAASLQEVADQLKKGGVAQDRGRMLDAILLARLLEREDPETGAGRFLAGEVARDSLRALRLARTLFVGLPPASPLAPKGWLAAGALASDSAGYYASEARRRWPSSTYVLAVDGKDSSDSLSIAAPEAALRTAWAHAIVLFADSVNAHRSETISAPASTPR